MRKNHDVAVLRKALGASVNDMAKIFDVSRQAVYTWSKGAGMTPENMAKVDDLVKAAYVFESAKITPNSYMLNRPLLNGKSFVQLVRGAPCSEAMARRLVEVLLREDRQRSEFARRFAHRPCNDFSDVGIPHLDEGRQ